MPSKTQSSHRGASCSRASGLLHGRTSTGEQWRRRMTSFVHTSASIPICAMSSPSREQSLPLRAFRWTIAVLKKLGFLWPYVESEGGLIRAVCQNYPDFRLAVICLVKELQLSLDQSALPSTQAEAVQTPLDSCPVLAEAPQPPALAPVVRRATVRRFRFALARATVVPDPLDSCPIPGWMPTEPVLAQALRTSTPPVPVARLLAPGCAAAVSAVGIGAIDIGSADTIVDKPGCETQPVSDPEPEREPIPAPITVGTTRWRPPFGFSLPYRAARDRGQL